MKVAFLLSLFLFSVFGDFGVDVVSVVQTADTLRAVQFIDVPPFFLDVRAFAIAKNNATATLDAVEFLIDLFGQTTIQFNYFQVMANLKNGQTQAGPTVANAADNSMAFRAFAVFEYDNKDGVPGFQETTGPNADVVTGLYDLSNFAIKWNPFVFSSTLVNGVNVTSVTATTADNVFSIKVTFSGNPIQIVNQAANAQTIITPMQVKVDFTIQWFNNTKNVKSLFSTGPSDPVLHPNASVGLATITAAASGMFTTQNGTKGASMTFGTSNFSTAFTYANNVVVIYNGIQATETVKVQIVTQSVNPTYQQYMNSWIGTWTEKIGFFSWTLPRPTLVFWDPIVGTPSPSNIGPSSTSSSGSTSVTGSASSIQSILFLLFAVLLLLL